MAKRVTEYPNDAFGTLNDVLAFSN